MEQIEETIVIVEDKNTDNGDNTPNNKQSQIAPAILVAGILIAGAILLKGNTGNMPVANNTENTNTEVKSVSSNDHILGNINSKIVIIEYSDLECPFCKVFHKTMHEIVESSNGKVAWVFRHYPIAQLHSKAFHEAEATECAYEQGGNDAFWKYVDRLFEITPSNDGLETALLSSIAQYAGLDVNSFNNCLNSGKYKDKIEADMSSGNKAGVKGTPASFILVRGKVVDNIRGAESYESIMQKLGKIK